MMLSDDWRAAFVETLEHEGDGRHAAGGGNGRLGVARDGEPGVGWRPGDAGIYGGVAAWHFEKWRKWAFWRAWVWLSNLAASLCGWRGVVKAAPFIDGGAP